MTSVKLVIKRIVNAIINGNKNKKERNMIVVDTDEYPEFLRINELVCIVSNHFVWLLNALAI